MGCLGRILYIIFLPIILPLKILGMLDFIRDIFDL